MTKFTKKSKKKNTKNKKGTNKNTVLHAKRDLSLELRWVGISLLIYSLFRVFYVIMLGIQIFILGSTGYVTFLAGLFMWGLSFYYSFKIMLEPEKRFLAGLIVIHSLDLAFHVIAIKYGLTSILIPIIIIWVVAYYYSIYDIFIARK